ncbi:MAG: hypothetical protein IKI75_03825 [Lachnospiraceae bacterium]|nr:hypothetical protein [Lachnospiraceae bacterium]
MKKDNIENRLKKAVEHATPDVLDGIKKRLEGECDAVVPMDFRQVSRRHRSRAWIGALAAAAVLVATVSAVLLSGIGKKPVVTLTPAEGVSEGGALLISEIVKLDPGYDPEELAAYSITELDTILSNTRHSKEGQAAAQAPLPTEAAADTAQMKVEAGSGNGPDIHQETEEGVSDAEDGQKPGDEAAAVSDNAVTEEDGEPEDSVSSDEAEDGADVQESPDADTEDGGEEEEPEEESRVKNVLSEAEIEKLALRDAGIGREEAQGFYMSSKLHTSYGLVYTVDFETEEYTFHYRIAEDGTMLTANKEFR